MIYTKSSTLCFISISKVTITGKRGISGLLFYQLYPDSKKYVPTNTDLITDLNLNYSRSNTLLHLRNYLLLEIVVETVMSVTVVYLRNIFDE